MSSFRVEKDAVGDVYVPSDALWGSSTQRAIDNFRISQNRFQPAIIQALAIIKQFAAEVNCELGLMDKKLSTAIAEAASAIAKGLHQNQFAIDVYQTGSGTSTNMNANEVIANLSNMALGRAAGEYSPVHPNDHVNMGQSSNDVMPSAMNIAAAQAITARLIPAIKDLHGAIAQKADEFSNIYKVGRTHLMDAVPMTLGQEFGGFARRIERQIDLVSASVKYLLELPLGGTAIGTGIGAHKSFGEKIVEKINNHLKIKFEVSKNRFEGISSRCGALAASAALRSLAVEMYRIADDIRLIASGPRLGLGEIALPPLQPGSSIMPGKVNPVIPEMVCEVCTQAIGRDASIASAAMAGHLELNTQLPVIAFNLIESIELLTNASVAFSEKCISGIRPVPERCQSNIELSLAMATALAPRIGYERAASIAKKAFEAGQSVREIVLEEGILPKDELNSLLDVSKLAGRK
jgi:fumarate hydratase class II